MKQKCKFTTKPSTISDGGYLKAHFIVWLNLCVNEITPEEGSADRYESNTDRLVLNDYTIESFLKAVERTHLCQAEDWEIEAILAWFGVENDINAWAQIRKAQIDGYDKSDTLNRFWLNDHPVWFDKSTRLGLAHMYQIIGDSAQVPSMWYNGVEFPMPSSEIALEILKDVEIYAMNCFAVTQRAMNEVDTLLANNDIEGLKAFQISERYPDWLRIGI